LLIAAVWRYGGSTNRSQAIWLGIATAMPFLGGLAWALRSPLNLPISVNPVPLLLSLLNAVLLYQVLRTGFADLVPLAALQVYRTMSDAVIVVNEVGSIVAMNPSAERLLFGVQPGTALAEASPEIAEHADRFMAGTAEYSEFELSYDHAVYWGRIRRTRDSRRSPWGFIVLLTEANRRF
jgi:PAS domain-containing protein